MRYAYVPESEAAHMAQVIAYRGTGGRLDQWHAPRVPARAPRGFTELAAGVVTLGKRLIELGWLVEPSYWLAPPGEGEGCAIKGKAGPLRLVATWKRPEDLIGGLAGWKTDVAYAWNVDVKRAPSKVGITELKKLVEQVGRVNSG